MTREHEVGLVEISRRKIVNIGGSPYVLVPLVLRDEIPIGTEVSWLRAPGSKNEFVLRFNSEKNNADRESENTKES